MIHSPQDIMASYFIAQGLGVQPPLPPASTDWPIYAGFMPPEGDQAVCIYDTAGVPNGRLMQGISIQHPGIQILVRHPDTRTCHDKAAQFYNKLQALRNVVVSFTDASYTVLNAAEIRLPVRVGQEIGKNRMIYTVNSVLTINEFNQVGL